MEKQNMWKKLFTAAALCLAFSASSLQAADITPMVNYNASQAPLVLASDGIAGDWFIICASVRKTDRSSYRAAQSKANRLGFTVINTNNYPNLTNGYWAVAEGPMAKFLARQDKPRGCYIKSGY